MTHTVQLTTDQLLLIQQCLSDMNILDENVLKHMDPDDVAATELTIEERTALIQLLEPLSQVGA